MGYSKEYIEWTNSNMTSAFSIKEISSGMLPLDSRDIECEGFGFVKMYKAEDGDLKLIFKDGSINRFVDIKTIYTK